MRHMKSDLELWRLGFSFRQRTKTATQTDRPLIGPSSRQSGTPFFHPVVGIYGQGDAHSHRLRRYNTDLVIFFHFFFFFAPIGVNISFSSKRGSQVSFAAVLPTFTTQLQSALTGETHTQSERRLRNSSCRLFSLAVGSQTHRLLTCQLWERLFRGSVCP